MNNRTMNLIKTFALSCLVAGCAIEEADDIAGGKDDPSEQGGDELGTEDETGGDEESSTDETGVPAAPLEGDGEGEGDEFGGEDGLSEGDDGRADDEGSNELGHPCIGTGAMLCPAAGAAAAECTDFCTNEGCAVDTVVVLAVDTSGDYCDPGVAAADCDCKPDFM